MINLPVEKKKEVIEHLRALSNKELGPLQESLGICSELESHFDINYSELAFYFKQWPEFSNSDEFPVPSETYTPDVAYCAKNLWLDNSYGDARRRLCAFLADCLQEEVIEELSKKPNQRVIPNV